MFSRCAVQFQKALGRNSRHFSKGTMGLFSRKVRVTPEEVAIGLLLFVWTWRRDQFFGDRLLNPDFSSELFRLRFFAVDLAAYKALERDPDKYESVRRALDSIQIEFLESPDGTSALAAASDSGRKRGWAAPLYEISYRDPAAYARFQQTKAFAPKFPRDQTLFRLFGEVLTLGNPASDFARVIRTFCELPNDITVPIKIAMTYDATHKAALGAFGSWRLVTS